MSSPQEVLLGILEDLRHEDFEKFKWYLCQDGVLEEFKPIPTSKLETLDRKGTVDQMRQAFSNQILDVTKMVLERMKMMGVWEKHSKHISEPGDELSPAQWSALVFILLSSEEDLKEFDLKKYSASERALLKLLPVVKASNKALLSGCGLSERSCGALSSLLSSQSSSLTHLDLSNNKLKDSGVKELSAAVEDPHCSLETLRLSCCGLSERSCGALSSVLSSQSSSLTHLDLSNNQLQDSGVKRLSLGLESPHCKLEALSLSGCLVSEEGCASLVSAVRSKSSHLRELDLSYNHPGDSGVKELSAAVEDPHCSLETLRF
ncbi:NACHT, LRR and PYD domains-containing protein 14-like [Salarias fasciatus]|uniref:NACHT, LRR and PYD domains-containing protein 14-like n=1 Tax=Salarias fasciatus TaxID=181472 RepID=UPI001176C4EE|nr:NACHT, LRR and PYD domains-containing protein 14-like [Salarias fasciatus]